MNTNTDLSLCYHRVVLSFLIVSCRTLLQFYFSKEELQLKPRIFDLVRSVIYFCHIFLFKQMKGSLENNTYLLPYIFDITRMENPCRRVRVQYKLKRKLLLVKGTNCKI